MKTLNRVMNDEGPRDYWNIVKAIGIICVVFGHSCTNFQRAVRFVYLFHLALFFFVSGYLWSEEKYGDDPSLNFAARLRANYGRYVFAAVVFVALHNFFVSTGIYTINDMERFGWNVSLANNTIGNPAVFYAGSFAGIYVCLSVAALLMKTGLLRKVMSFIGRYSFEIMAWHLLVVKVIDLGFAAITGEKNAAIYGAFTNAYASQLWWLYLSLGVGVPAVVASGIGLMIRQLSQLPRRVIRA